MTALYIRLSKEDENGRESNSVQSQRALLTDYAEKKGFYDLKEYTDDGYSGTNLHRPALERMREDIAAGRIKTVIVKDLSRLARNSGDSNAMLDEFFPMYGVRFISVCEGIDTALTSYTGAFAPIANMLHEYYARDISAKIRSALYSRMDSGRYTGAKPPFGYCVCDGVLVPNVDGGTVEKIFLLASSGTPPADIARKFGLTPARVRGIIRNRVYLGELWQGKRRKLSFKSDKVVSVPEEQWHYAAGTHIPLTDGAHFERANFYLAKRSHTARTSENIFSGLVYCADCGARMSTVGTRRTGSPCALACSAYKRGGADVCSNHHIDYVTLCEAIAESLRDLNADAGKLSRLSGVEEDKCRDFLRFDTLDSALLDALICRIEVHQGTPGRNRRQNITILYRFSS